MNFNPWPHMQHAWQETGTVWAKLALLLFYLFVWVNVIISIWAYVNPSMGPSHCIMDTLQNNDWARTLYTEAVRAYFVTFVGFLLMADVAGAHLKSIVFVAVIYTWMGLGTNRALGYAKTIDIFHPDDDDNVDKGDNKALKACVHDTLDTYILWNHVWIAWLWVTVVSSWLDKKMTTNSRGGTGERQPLTG